MHILVKRGCLSAYGKIFRRGDVVELGDEVGASLLQSDAFEEKHMEPQGKKPTTKRKVKTKADEDALPAPDIADAVVE